MKRYAVLSRAVLVIAVNGCAHVDANMRGSTSEPRSSLTAILLDRSGSRSQLEINQDRQLLSEVINGLGFGERLLIEEVHREGRKDGAPRWMTEMPVPNDSTVLTAVDNESLRRARSAAVVAVAAVFDSSRPNRTDLMATLFDVGELARQTPSPYWRVLMLSDMLQSTHDVNMEAPDGIPNAGWISEEKRQGFIPDLAGACVVVVGADRSTDHGKRVFTFWRQYFQAAGTDLSTSNYQYLAFHGVALRCSKVLAQS